MLKKIQSARRNVPARVSDWRLWLKIIWFLFLGVVLAGLGYIVWQNREMLLKSLRTAQYGYFVLAFLFYTLAIMTAIIGWHLILRQVTSQLSFLTDAKTYLYTLAARRVPGTVWYIAGRSVLYRRIGISGKLIAAASGIEAVLSVVSGLMIGVPALFFFAGPSLVTIVVFIAVEVAGLVVLTPRVLSKLLVRLGYEAQLRQLDIVHVLAWLGAYSVTWIFGGLVVFAIIMSIYSIETAQALNVISIYALAGAAAYLTFFLPTSLGFTEIAMTFMLSSIIPLPVAVTVSILARVLTTIFDVMWSSLYLWGPIKNSRVE